MAKIDTNTKMTLEHFHDMYYLQAMEAAVKMAIVQNSELEFSKPVEKFIISLENAIDYILPNMALRTFMYLYAACLGEARHSASTIAMECFIPAALKKDRYDLFSNITDFPPTPDNLEELEKVFRQPWKSGYGGTAWADIAHALKDYNTLPPAAWLDHVIDLEHNNGTVFSKSDGEETLFFSIDYPERFSAFLDYKFRKDILVKAPSYTKTLRLSSRVYSLVQKYCMIFKVPEPKFLEGTLDTLTDYTVEWGNASIKTEKKWADWAAVHNGNSPDVKEILNQAGLFDFYSSYYTAEDYVKKLEGIKKMALDIVVKNATPSLKSAITKTINAHKKENIGKCKLPKAEKTFPFLPCTIKMGRKVSQIAQQVIFSFPFEYQDGYGTRTDDGFSVTIEMKNGSQELLKKMLKDSTEAYISSAYGDLQLHVGKEYFYLTSPVLEALLG